MVDLTDLTKGSRAADELEEAIANLITEVNRLVRQRNDYQARVIPAETKVVRLEAVNADMLAALKQVEAEMRAGFGLSFGETREQVRRAIRGAESEGEMS